MAASFCQRVDWSRVRPKSESVEGSNTFFGRPSARSPPRYVKFYHRLIEEIERHIPVTAVCSIDDMAFNGLRNVYG
jgi:hypothetical protein